MANIVGVLLIVLCLVGLPLHYLSPDGSSAEAAGDWISEYLGVAHGWLYMIFLVMAFILSRRARWDLQFTLVTLLLGTVPVLSFWAEHRATKRVQQQLASTSAGSDSATTRPGEGRQAGSPAEPGTR